MRHNSQQIARVLVKLLQSGRGSWSSGWLALVLVLAAGYLLAEPALEAKWKTDLPGVNTPELPVARPETLPRKQSPSAQSEAPKETAQASASLDTVFEEIGRETYRTPAGLIYGHGSAHGTRLAHLLSHVEDDPSRPGEHGVFDQADPVRLILLVDEAYQQGLSGENVHRERQDNREVYTVDLGRRIGFIGGEQGNRRHHPSANHLRLVVEGERFVTAFPVRP